jgi:A/G-specific adenine glycosylase
MRARARGNGSATAELCETFAARVVAWQRAHGRHDLPWQRTRDAYRIWLSEIMLQQTQVATVLPYYQRFVAEFPVVADLATASIGRVLELWSGLGYYRRAHHLHEAARIVVREHGGRFPVDAATLLTLPGIGESTANAIAAFASGERRAILDGNVKRVLARHRGIGGWPGEPRVQAELWRVAAACLPESKRAIGAYTQGLMDLGATVCTRAKPDCAACPVAADCVARRDERVDELPYPRPRRALPRRDVTVLLLTRGGDVLLEQRPPVGVWSGLWSLPEVAREADVALHVAARFNAATDALSPLPPVTHVFTHFALTMHPVRVPVTHWPSTAGARGVEWFARDTAIAAAVPAPIRRLLQAHC